MWNELYNRVTVRIDFYYFSKLFMVGTMFTFLSTKKELHLGVVSNLPSDHIELAIEPTLDLAIQIPQSVV